ncbi:hypothetical protein OHV05_15265 [Kitasatospora sp. NBC_00070]|uniref:hypothetical protein n=1 Tax=Kitasatospora sp. NBC_00070 TaxID=2975962 RepID=UPI003246C223
MITVTRIRLDTGAPVVIRATADNLDIAIDDRHITPTGAVALHRALTQLGDEPPAGAGDCS